MAEDRSIEHAPEDGAARRQAEETVRFQAHVLDHVGQAVIATDLDGAIVYANRFAERLYGWSAGEMRGQPITDVTVPQIGVEEARAIMARLRAGESWRGEFAVRRRDGSTFPAEVTNTPIRAMDGTLVGIVGISVDITERRQAEADLRLQSAALNAAADAIVITDPTGAIEWVNRAFIETSGYEAAEVIGRNPRELFKSGTHDRAFYQRLWDTIRAGRVWQGEMTNRRKDGRLVPEELTITPVRDGVGAIAHFVAIKRDLTEMKRLQAEVVQAQKLETVGRLAGGIAHDFNNLLTVINATAELAASAPDTPAGVRTDLGHIREAGERAANLTRQLLAFSRKQILQPVVLDVDALVQNLRSMLPRLIGEDIELVVRSPADPARVKADPSQIEQVILNLVVNARDAMPDGGRLTIEIARVDLDDDDVARHGAGRAGPHVMLAVGDTGIGMDDATRAQIFEPFFTTKEPGKAPAWAFRPSTASCTRAAAASGSTASRGWARRSGSTCRGSMPPRPCHRAIRHRPSAARRRSSSSRTTPRSAAWRSGCSRWPGTPSSRRATSRRHRHSSRETTCAWTPS